MKTLNITIGRETGNTIVLNDPTDVTSRQHAVLTVMPSGKMTITDTSANGTYINGQRISSNVPVPVTRKDTVSFAHQISLDWKQVPKAGLWLKYLVVGLGVAAVASLIAIFWPKLFPPEPVNPDTPKPPVEVVSSDCIINFDANGGEGIMGPQTVKKGAAAGLIPNTFTREHYLFKGWKMTPNGENVEFEDKAVVTRSENSVTLYACWEAKTIKVIFKQNDRSVGGKMDPLIIKEGDEAVLPASAFRKNGYRFMGWNTNPKGNGDAYADEATIAASKLTMDLTLYAQWEKKTVKESIQNNDTTKIKTKKKDLG